MGFLLLIRVPTPHSQHSLVHLIGSETLLRSVRSHDAQVSIRSTAVGWARRSGAAAAVSLKSVAKFGGFENKNYYWDDAPTPRNAPDNTADLRRNL